MCWLKGLLFYLIVQLLNNLALLPVMLFGDYRAADSSLIQDTWLYLSLSVLYNVTSTTASFTWVHFFILKENPTCFHNCLFLHVVPFLSPYFEEQGWEVCKIHWLGSQTEEMPLLYWFNVAALQPLLVWVILIWTTGPTDLTVSTGWRRIAYLRTSRIGPQNQYSCYNSIFTTQNPTNVAWLSSARAELPPGFCKQVHLKLKD